MAWASVDEMLKNCVNNCDVSVIFFFPCFCSIEQWMGMGELWLGTYPSVEGFNVAFDEVSTSKTN